jgi:hypothetical protein
MRKLKLQVQMTLDRFVVNIRKIVFSRRMENWWLRVQALKKQSGKDIIVYGGDFCEVAD